MNTSINPRDPKKTGQQPSFDKTFVEGAQMQTNLHAFDTSSRINATQAGATNPYGPQGRAAPQANELPSGNEPLPLGSGTVVGLLGAGGMARVYKIWNDKLEVFRAVKILIPTQQGDLGTVSRPKRKSRPSSIIPTSSKFTAWETGTGFPFWKWSS